MLKVIKPTIEAGQPAHLISFHGEHPEPYSDEQLEVLRLQLCFEIIGFVLCLAFVGFVMIGLLAIL